MALVNGDKSSFAVHCSRVFLVRDALEARGPLSGDREAAQTFHRAETARERQRQADWSRDTTRRGSIRAWRADDASHR